MSRGVPAPHDGHPAPMAAVEGAVPEGQQSVTLPDGGADEGGARGVQQPRLPARRVQVGVGTEKRLQSPRLIPPHQQLRLRVLKEAPDVGWGGGWGTQSGRVGTQSGGFCAQNAHFLARKRAFPAEKTRFPHSEAQLPTQNRGLTPQKAGFPTQNCIFPTENTDRLTQNPNFPLKVGL